MTDFGQVYGEAVRPIAKIGDDRVLSLFAPAEGARKFTHGQDLSG